MHTGPQEELSAFLVEKEACDFTGLFSLHPSWDIRSLANLPIPIPDFEWYKRWCSATQSLILKLTISHVDASALISPWLLNTSTFLAQIDPDLCLASHSFLLSKAREISRLITHSLDTANLFRASLLLRQATDMMRTVYGTRKLLSELQMTELHLPAITYDETYGRHWDILENLFEKFQVRSFVEVGVALGGLALMMLNRNIQFSYVGVDPFLTLDTVKAITLKGNDRAVTYNETSVEASSRFADFSLDCVFIDGPHTFVNVKRDIQTWLPKIREGGIISGHDFTAQHPPLVWAVLEQAVVNRVSRLNLGMDGIWWWQKASPKRSFK